MHIHILGICGTFMGGIAQLAQALGHRVTGADAQVYPPMSEQLEAAGISIWDGYDPRQLQPAPDLIIIGNALSRGNPAVEYILDHGLRYTSGPQWLGDELLSTRWVLGVAGTHGKTTTASLLAWILEYAGMEPGFLIGGVPRNFEQSARLGQGRFFVVEADEYDTAFFDKRSKFVHYHPRTLIANNLEFDHADIFEHVGMIQRQFHHLLRTLPASGLIVNPDNEPLLDEVFAMGCWTPRERLSLTDPLADWSARDPEPDGQSFSLHYRGAFVARIHWSQGGRHNLFNALAAIGAAHHAGVPLETMAGALQSFTGVKRRMEQRGTVAGIEVYDDFAHHPTAIATTLDGARKRWPDRRLLVALEPRSNTMRLGVQADRLAPALEQADEVFLFVPPGLTWDPGALLAPLGSRLRLAHSVPELVAQLDASARSGDRIVIMSNGGFGGIHPLLLKRLEQRTHEPG